MWYPFFKGIGCHPLSSLWTNGFGHQTFTNLTKQLKHRYRELSGLVLINFRKTTLCIRKINNEPFLSQKPRASHNFGETKLIAQRISTDQRDRPEGLGTNKPEGPLMRRMSAISVKCVKPTGRAESSILRDLVNFTRILDSREITRF